MGCRSGRSGLQLSPEGRSYPRLPLSRTDRGSTSYATDEAQIAAGPSRVAGSYLSGA